jgi:hypothetical protein
MKRLTLWLTLCASLAYAKDKPQPSWIGGELLGFHDIHSGQSCSSNGTVNGTADDDGNVKGTTQANTNCTPHTTREYNVKIGDQKYAIRPAMSGKQKGTALATMGWSAVFTKNSVLSGQMPGAHFEAHFEGSDLHIKIGKRESLYAVVFAGE